MPLFNDDTNFLSFTSSTTESGSRSSSINTPASSLPPSSPDTGQQTAETLPPLAVPPTTQSDVTEAPVEVSTAPASAEHKPGVVFIDHLVRQLKSGFVAFDTAPQPPRRHFREPDVASAFSALRPGTQTQVVHWFGAACTIMRDAVRLVQEYHLVPDSLESMGITVAQARTRFANGLVQILHRLLNTRTGGGGRGVAWRGAHTAPAFAPALESYTWRCMTEWLEKSQPPAAHDDDGTSHSSSPMQELIALLERDVEVWVTSFYPALLFLDRMSAEGGDDCASGVLGHGEGGDQQYHLPNFLRDLVDAAPRTHPVLHLGPVREPPTVGPETGQDHTQSAEGAAMDELATHLYTYYALATLENYTVVKGHPGHVTGVLVPRDWLERFTRWAAWAWRWVCDSDSAGTPCPTPGPIRTFDCVSVSPSHPALHATAVGDEADVEVVPERLFDALFFRFGGGPKYLLHGHFDQRSSLVRALTPPVTTVSLAFTTHEVKDAVRDEQSVTVYVEEVLPQTDLAEVLRRGLELVREAEGTMSGDELERWSAGVYGSRAVRLLVKECRGHHFSPPLVVPGEVGDVSVRSLAAWVRPSGWADASSRACEPRCAHEGLSLEVVLRTAQDVDLGDGGVELLVTPETLTRRGVCGLTNNGNTCYMNSAIQSLSNLTCFRRELLALPLSSFPPSPTVSALVRLMSTMWSGQYRYVVPIKLKRAISRMEKRFASFEQEDANEFVEVLLDQVHVELNRVAGQRYRERGEQDKVVPVLELAQAYWEDFLKNNRSFVPPLFFYQSKTRFACLTCGESSTVFDNNITLSVNIKEPPRRCRVNAVVSVHVPPLDDDDGAHAVVGDGSGVGAVPDPQRCFVMRVFVYVQLRHESAGEPAVEDLAAALRKALCGSEEVLTRVRAIVRSTLGPEAQDAPPQELPMGLVDYDVTVVGSVERGAFFASATARPAHTLSGRTDAPLYHVCYFLKRKNDRLLPNAHALLCMEPIYAPTHLCSGVDPPPPTAVWDGGSGGTTRPSRLTTATAPVSMHILTTAQYLAQRMLRRWPRGEGALDDVDDASSTTLEGGGADVAAAIAPESGVMEGDATAATRRRGWRPGTPLLKVQYVAPSHTRCHDLAASAERVGDDWLPGVHDVSASLSASSSVSVGQTAEEVEGRGCESSASSHRGTARAVYVFLLYDDELYTLRDSPVQRHGSYIPVIDGNEDSEGEDEGGSTLHDCLANSMEPFTLTGDDAWYCPKCKTHREAVMRRSVFRLPPCLLISFRRFKMDSYTEKNNTVVSFPVKLDFAPYLDPDARSLAQPTQYRLRSVVYHSGTLRSGHYVATAYNDTLKRWICFNDWSTSIMSGTVPRPRNAYMLWYERVETSDDAA